jgi:group I intron endonuclease
VKVSKKIKNKHFIIYKITNLVTGMIYIGLTTNPADVRLSQHGYDNGYIARAIRKYGRENFTIIVVLRCSNMTDLKEKEKFCIRIFNSLTPNGYNLTKGGEEGKEYSEETLQRMSEGQKRRWAQGNGTENSLKALNDPNRPGWNLGLKMSKEHCQKLSEAHMGYTMPQSQRDAIGKANKGKPHKDSAGVKRIDVKTGEIKIYNSFKDTEKDGFNRSNVWRAATEKRKTNRKYKWELIIKNS